MNKVPKKYIKMAIFNIFLIIFDIVTLSNGFLGLLKDKDNVLLFAIGVTIAIMSIVSFFYVNYTLLQEKKEHKFNINELDGPKDYIEVLESLKTKRIFLAEINEAIEQISRLERKNQSFEEIYFQKFQEDSNGTGYGFDDIISQTNQLLFKNIEKMINVILIFDYTEYQSLTSKAYQSSNKEKMDFMKSSINYVKDTVQKNEKILLNEDKLLLEMSKIGDTEEDDEVNLTRINDIVESMAQLRVKDFN